MAISAARKLDRLMRQALSLVFWRRPKSAVELVGFGSFLFACAFSMAVFALQDIRDADPGSVFYPDGLHQHASYFLAILAATWLGSWLLKRPALWLTLASTIVLVATPWLALALQLPFWLADAEPLQLQAWQVLVTLGAFIALLRTIGFLARDTGIARRFIAGVLIALLLAAPWTWRQSSWLWYAPDDQDDEEVVQKSDHPIATPDFDPEALVYEQPALLRRALATLRPQTPGRIDLYGLGFAGDGAEPVFRNEVDYFGELMTGRFDAGQRTVPLVNSPDTIATEPLATLSNLRAALAGIGASMDRDQDVLLLFLTSHGSQDHQLYVAMDPLVLDQVRPEDLRSALDDAGIRWRVVVVSSCYSGGFVDALRGPRTLVITSARSDRSSFGCGVDSDITWFGKAFLGEALNQTADFDQAFAIASRRVRKWELEQGQTPSVPQIAEGSEIAAHLQAWRAGLKPGPMVAFRPTR